MRIVFVCHGNTCRSPMAEAIARQWLTERGIAIEVASAGVSAQDGSPASGGAVQAMRERGLDLSAHRSQSVWDLDIGPDDQLWCMQTAHVSRIRATRTAWPAQTLGDAAGTHDDVPDPYGGSSAVYADTAQTLTSRVHAALTRCFEA